MRTSNLRDIALILQDRTEVVGRIGEGIFLRRLRRGDITILTTRGRSDGRTTTTQRSPLLSPPLSVAREFGSGAAAVAADNLQVGWHDRDRRGLWLQLVAWLHETDKSSLVSHRSHPLGIGDNGANYLVANFKVNDSKRGAEHAHEKATNCRANSGVLRPLQVIRATSRTSRRR